MIVSNVKMFKDSNALTEVIEFNSLNEFYDYVTKTPINDVFKSKKLSSIAGNKSFTKTNSFEEAVDLFKNGWSDMSNELVKKLKKFDVETKQTMKRKQSLSVCGYQAIVPLYLNGVPNNMVNNRLVPVKQKVITLNKSICYNASITIEQIIEESIKTLQIIKNLESQGYRCNLNILWAINEKYNAGRSFVIKIKVKSSNEKLNISKLAFPLVHPSMLRRLLFRFLEVYPNTTKALTYGYGYPVIDSKLKNASFHKNGEYLLPAFITKNIEEISSIDDLV